MAGAPLDLPLMLHRSRGKDGSTSVPRLFWYSRSLSVEPVEERTAAMAEHPRLAMQIGEWPLYLDSVEKQPHRALKRMFGAALTTPRQR
jgi:hypothetical protein